MERESRKTQPRRTAILPTAGMCLVISCAWGLTGCADHRISLDQFLEMEQTEKDRPPPEISSEEAQQIKSLIDEQLGPYKIGPSDVLGVAFAQLNLQDSIPPLQVRVDRNGEVELPVVGRIRIAGFELEDAEDAIQKLFVPAVFRDGVVHVTLIEVETTDVLVHGAVANPGLVPLRRTDRDLLHAIVGAAGVSDTASGRVTLRRIRNPEDITTLDLTEPEGLREGLALAPLEDGDVITVEASAPNSIYVGGLVNAPRPQLYPPGVGVTFLQALAAAGGVRTDVFPRDATLIRRMPDGQDVHVKIDLERTKKGTDPNIMLAAGDIVWVPETAETRVQDFINRNFFFRAGFSANVTYNVTGIEFMNRANLQSAGVANTQSSNSRNPLALLYNSVLQNQATAVGP